MSGLYFGLFATVTMFAVIGFSIKKWGMEHVFVAMLILVIIFAVINSMLPDTGGGVEPYFQEPY